MISLTTIFKNLFEEKEENEVQNVSFSAVGIGPELVTNSANIPDQASFDDFKSSIDQNLSNTFINLFKQTKKIDGVTIDFGFSYGNSTILLKLAGRKTKLRRTDNTEWFGLNMIEVLINSKDTPIDSKKTFVDLGIKYLKARKVKSYSRDYIGTLLDFIKQEVDKLRERTRATQD